MSHLQEHMAGGEENATQQLLDLLLVPGTNAAAPVKRGGKQVLSEPGRTLPGHKQ